MKYALIGLIAVLTASSHAAAQAAQLEFRYSETPTWKYFLGDSKADPAKTWSTKDGIIICQGKPAGYMISEQEFSDYTLKLEWRWPKGTQGGNSGVLLHVQAPDKVWPKSVEAQLQHGQAGDFWLIDAKLDIDEARRDPSVSRHFIRLGESWEKTGAKDKKGKDEMKAVRKSFENPIGEWNQYEIVCEGNNVKLKINGKFVNEGKNGELLKGKIALQSEGAEIHFRKIEITPISK